MAREITEDLDRLIAVLEDPTVGSYDKLMYVQQAVIVLLKEVKKLKK